ncbi:9528_t:CDS:2 [Racocetra fulgida]|uniref:9528_t:CDS:1 n=1 Tax=Racocetra fulgida TaxID=60492 RepID=A0A9N8Z059_9GLOM|nr:9528_t:CDS:2 [Racocetra fulgida]
MSFVQVFFFLNANITDNSKDGFEYESLVSVSLSDSVDKSESCSHLSKRMRSNSPDDLVSTEYLECRTHNFKNNKVSDFHGEESSELSKKKVMHRKDKECADCFLCSSLRSYSLNIDTAKENK